MDSCAPTPVSAHKQSLCPILLQETQGFHDEPCLCAADPVMQWLPERHQGEPTSGQRHPCETQVVQPCTQLLDGKSSSTMLKALLR